MDVPERIRHTAKRLRQSKKVNRMTVRHFLRHFGVERRGAVKVEEIQKILDSLGLETDPDGPELPKRMDRRAHPVAIKIRRLNGGDAGFNGDARR
jgi:hypothetical protein